MHGRDEPDESKEMVAVQVADKNVVDALHPDPVAPELDLGALGAVDKEEPLVVVHHLCCRAATDGGNGRVAAEDDNLENHVLDWALIYAKVKENVEISVFKSVRMQIDPQSFTIPHWFFPFFHGSFCKPFALFIIFGLDKMY
jgi:hypothetical protein